MMKALLKFKLKLNNYFNNVYSLWDFYNNEVIRIVHVFKKFNLHNFVINVQLWIIAVFFLLKNAISLDVIIKISVYKNIDELLIDKGEIKWTYLKITF